MSKLTEKHRAVLALMKENRHSTAEIARQTGFSASYLYDLQGGEGAIGQLFVSEWSKIKKEIEERTSEKITSTREILVNKLHTWAKNVKEEDINSVSRHKQLIDAINALSKAVPMVNIESNEWHTNLTGDNIVNEFKRLRSLARSSTVRERVSSASKDGTGEIPVSPEASDNSGEGLQDTKVPAKPQTKRFSL